MKAIGHIYLTWRKGKGASRIAVGVIERDTTGAITFRYLSDGVQKAEKEGFTPYTDFPDRNKTYTENVIDIFGQRLNRPERSDIQNYYDFWEVEPEYQLDKFYLLAHTQGMLSTDNFEFLADYFPVKDLRFISEICGLSTNRHPADLIQEGEELEWTLDPDNEYDKKAVRVHKKGEKLGYIKSIHCDVFSKPGGEKLKIKVKSIDKNGHLNRVFVTVYMP